MALRLRPDLECQVDILFIRGLIIQIGKDDVVDTLLSMGDDGPGRRENALLVVGVAGELGREVDGLFLGRLDG